MKSILTLVMFFALLTGVNANHNKATIVIKSENNTSIIVQLDHQHNAYAQPIHKFEGIRPGNHYVKILRPRNHHHHHQNGAQLIYSGHIKAYNGYKAIYKVDCGRLILLHKKPIQYHHYPTSCSCPNHGYCNNNSCGCNSCGGGYQNNNYGGYGSNGQGCQSEYPAHYQGYGWNGNNNNGYYNQNEQYGNGDYNGYYGPRSNYKKGKSVPLFNKLMAGVRQISNDNDKVVYIKQNLGNQKVSVEQVEDILEEVFFESNKVELAQFLYPKTSDKKEFHKVMDAFHFSSSKKSINRLIQK